MEQGSTIPAGYTHAGVVSASLIIRPSNPHPDKKKTGLAVGQIFFVSKLVLI